MDEASVASGNLPNASGRRIWEPAFLLCIVALIFLARLTTLPVRGEESRWARVAYQMVHLGDWIVPRQQGQPYIDRPPAAQWAIAAVGIVRGKIDLIAIRLPSVLAVLLTVLLIYGYGRTFLQPWAAFTAGLIYATFGQVLQLGRLGENEALYTFMLGGGLLVWHWGYCQQRNRLATWVAGGLLVSLAALMKGPQAPVYFMAATTVFLLLRRDWKWLFSWQPVAALAAFVGVFSIWQVPFFLATDWTTTIGMWTRSSAYRYTWQGVGAHVLTYPFETFGCMLPWSPFLLGLVRPRVRRQLGRLPQQLVFVLTAIAVTYPSVWLAAGARGRYFMPLYPGFALLIAFVIERSVLASSGTAARKGWELFVVVVAALIAVSGPLVLLASLGAVDVLEDISQPLAFAGVFAALAVVAAALLMRQRGRSGSAAAQLSVVTLALFLGLAYTGAVINIRARRGNDLTEAVAQLKQSLPTAAPLVSFGPVDHRFAYYFEDPIRQSVWPRSPEQLPPELQYFCYKHHRGDTATRRRSGRGMVWEVTPGTLPFAWQEIARLPCDRNVRTDPEVIMVIGRVLEPLAAAPAERR